MGRILEAANGSLGASRHVGRDGREGVNQVISQVQYFEQFSGCDKAELYNLSDHQDWRVYLFLEATGLLVKGFSWMSKVIPFSDGNAIEVHFVTDLPHEKTYGLLKHINGNQDLSYVIVERDWFLKNTYHAYFVLSFNAVGLWHLSNDLTGFPNNIGDRLLRE